MPSNMVKYQSMIRANIAEVKANLSSYMERVEGGEVIVVCRRNVPIAEIRPVRKLPAQPRPVGIDPGMTIPPSFFEPLPDTLLDAFEGRDESK
jgi:prevent-host-death family protein